MTKRDILNYYRKIIEKSRFFCTGIIRKLQNGCRQIIEKAQPFCTGIILKLQNGCRQVIEKTRPFRAGIIRKLQNGYRQVIEKSRFFCSGIIRKLQNGCRQVIEKTRPFRAGIIRQLKSYCTVFPKKLQWLGKSCKHIGGRQIDIILLAVTITLLVFLFFNRAYEAVIETDRVNISITSQFGNLFGRKIVDALIREFEEKNPDLRIQEITSEAAVPEGADVNGGADIVLFDDGGCRDLLNASALVSLASYHHAESQTEKWALPLVTFMDLFIYNIDILQEANLDRPPKTRAEFLAAAKTVVENNAAPSGPPSGPPSGAESVFAFALGLSPADPLALRRDFYPWVWANGGEVYLETAEPTLSKPVIDAVTFLEQLNRDGLLAPGTFEKTGAQRLKEFAEGKIAMMTVSEQDIAFLQKAGRGITFGITTLPAMTQGINRLGISSIYAGINSDCPLPDEAWRFLAFLAGKKDVFAEALGAVPGNFPNVFVGEYIEKNPLYSKAWDIFEAADIVEYEPGQPFEKEFNRLIREKLAEAFR